MPKPSAPKPVLIEATDTLEEFAFRVGHALGPDRILDRPDYLFARGVVLEVVGPRGFSASLSRVILESHVDAIRRVYAQFRDHLRYHQTLDRMVRKEMARDDAVCVETPEG